MGPGGRGCEFRRCCVRPSRATRRAAGLRAGAQAQARPQAEAAHHGHHRPLRARCDVLCELPAALLRRVEHVRRYAVRRHHIDLQLPGSYLLTTDTPCVMRWLHERMPSSALHVRLMQSFTPSARHRDGWRVDDLVHTCWLVGADGAKSRISARCVLGRVGQFLYGVEYEFDGATLAGPGALHCSLDRHCALGYLGWAAQEPAQRAAGAGVPAPRFAPG